MKSRALILINAIGCLALTGLVVVQWRKERATSERMVRVMAESAAANERAAEEGKRRAALERDIATLKETIDSIQKSAETSADAFAQKDQLANQLDAELKAAREQLTSWEAALKARDERIRTLDSNLAATRQRLDEAIRKLKAAGAE